MSEAYWTGGWGTDVDEVFPTFELAKQYALVEFEPGGQFAAEGTWRFGPLDIASWVEGSVGWSLASCDVELPSGPQQFRATMIFHLERGEWKMVHQHRSFAASEELWGGEPGRALRIMAAIGEAQRSDLTEWTSVEGTTTLVFTDRPLTSRGGYPDRARMAVES